MAKNILVAGGAGYIGSHFCKLAAEKGYTPITVDRLTSASSNVENFRRHAVQWGPLEVTDIGDTVAVAKIVERYKPVAAVCFASLIEVAESVAKPDMYWENNFYKVIRFFKTIERGGVRNVVFSSTAAVYGNPANDQPLLEDGMLAPINPYGMTKLACEVGLHGLEQRLEVSSNFVEELCKRALQLDTVYPEFRSSFFPCFKSVIFRYFNAAGADADAVIGEMHEPETHLIPNAILASMGARGTSFTLNGTDYQTPDGTCVRDFVHVNDLAMAHIQGVEYLLNGGQNEVFNLGSGKGNSVKEIINGIKKVTSNDFKVNEGPRREGDPAFLVADIGKAEKILGWKPQATLDDIIASAVKFHKKHG